MDLNGQQKNHESEGNVPVIEVATTEDPSATETIQSGSTFTSDQVKYVFQTENTEGQVTYRVIQMSEGQPEVQTDGSALVSLIAGFPNNAQLPTQGLAGSGTETQYAYSPATVPSATCAAMVTTEPTQLGQTNTTGPLYVMMSPQEVVTANLRPIVPRSPVVGLFKKPVVQATRDDSKRSKHNEVERRRRDKIHNWIVQLSKTLPNCDAAQTKCAFQSKEGILSNACDYIKELRQGNHKLSDDLATLERLRVDNQLLRQEVQDWKSRNQILGDLLTERMIVGVSNTDGQ